MTTTSSLDHRKPSPASVYCDLAGGIDSSGADREIACTLAPDENSILPVLIRRNRKLLEGAVDRLARDGIRNFLDLGAGPPIRLRDGTRLPMVHEVAKAAGVSPWVAYVDNDALAFAHLAAATVNQRGVNVIKADLADPDSPEIRGVLHAMAGEPSAVVFGLSLHYWRAGVAREIVGWYLDQLPAGSAAVITVAHLDEEMVAQRRELLPLVPFNNHGRAAVREFFSGLSYRPMLAAEGGRHARIVGGIGVKR